MAVVAPSLIAIVVPRMLGGLPAQGCSADRQHQGVIAGHLRHALPWSGGGARLLQACVVEKVAKMLHVGHDKVHCLLRID